MKALDFEWKVINSYHVRVRQKNRLHNRYVKMSLQLYQVDSKSYLLDFKSLSNEESENNSGFLSNIATPVQTGENVVSTKTIQGHHTMEFFEMCAALIIQLAR